MGRILAEPVQVETFTLEPIVGASLLAKAVCQSANVSLIYRHREQAHSYMGSVCVGMGVRAAK
jgi:hypothetical protein